MSASSDAYNHFFSPVNEAFYVANQYLKLDDSRQEIRLLKLFSGNENEQIVCELLSNCFLTEDHLQYRAISYCAGDSTETTVILVNGREFNAFASLERALKRIRSQLGEYQTDNGVQILWADQICINQSNPDEKYHQVAQMRQIYEQASEVLVWLGEGNSAGGGLEHIALMDQLLEREALLHESTDAPERLLEVS